MSQSNFDQLDQLASDFWQWRAFYKPNSRDDIKPMIVGAALIQQQQRLL